MLHNFLLMKNRPGCFLECFTGSVACVLGILLFVVCFIQPRQAFAAEINVSWDYSGDVSDLSGFKLYQDGSEICLTGDPAARQMTCTVTLDVDPAAFTMTAYDVYGNESSQSTPFQVSAPAVPPVGNSSPVAVALADVIEGQAPLAVNFDGSGSSDLDGEVVTYSWDFGDGTSGNGVSSAYVYTSAGIYSAVLTVTDDQGGSAQVTTLITVSDAIGGGTNEPPTVELSASVQSGVAPLSVIFDGSGSSDLDGVIAAHSWDFGDGDVASGVVANHSFTVAGIYTVRLTIMDDAGDTAIASITITIQTQENPQNNESPQAALTASVLAGDVPLLVDFDASGSSDSDGALFGYFWDFGDGSTGSGINAQHVFGVAGEFTVSLVVTDDLGATSQAQTLITVASVKKGNKPPKADFSVTKGKGRNKPKASLLSEDEDYLYVSLDASPSDDPDGMIVDYLWDFGDGETADGETVDHTYALAGDYTITLSVMDNEGATSAAGKIVSITEAPIAYDGTLVATENNVVQGTMETSDSQGLDLVYTVLTQGEKGSVNLLEPATGQFVYTPNAGATGIDTFTFQVSKGGLESNTATITVSIARQDAVEEAETPTASSPPSPFTGVAATDGGGGGCSIASGRFSPAHTADWLLVAACLAWIGLQPVIRNRRK